MTSDYSSTDVWQNLAMHLILNQDYESSNLFASTLLLNVEIMVIDEVLWSGPEIFDGKKFGSAY